MKVEKNKYYTKEDYLNEYEIEADIGKRVSISQREYCRMKETPKHVTELLDRLLADGIEWDEIFDEFQHVEDIENSTRLKYRAPTPADIRPLVELYDKIEPYLPCLDKISVGGPFPSREVAHLIKIMNEVCSRCRFTIDQLRVFASAPEQEQSSAFTPSYFPVTEFDMSGLYSFFVEEHLIVDIDEDQFTDCINKADIKPLWETTESKNKFKLALRELKRYYQNDYEQKRRFNPEWYLKCCDSIGVSVDYMGKMRILDKTRAKFCKKMKEYIKNHN